MIGQSVALNTQSPVPLYRQLADLIRADIEAGHYAVEARIPSENQMADRYSIGRPTVRQATDMLVRSGMLVRRRGSGTFVRSPSRSIDLFSLAGTSAALQKSELDCQLEFILGPVRDDTRQSADRLRHEGLEGESAQEWFRIERRAIVGEVPVLYETLWFDCDLFAGLENRSLQNQSLSTLVRDDFFLEPTAADQTFYVVNADPIMAARLDVAVDTALLKVQRAIHFGEHRGALDAEIVCRTDCFEFSQTLYPAQAE